MRFAISRAIETEPMASPNALWLALENACDALARFDERLKASPVREGFLARLDFHEACAAVRNEGFLVHLEDLVLHDVGMDVRTPTAELVRAHAMLRARRRMATAPPEMPTVAGILALASERADGGKGRKGEGASGPNGDASDGEPGTQDDLLAAIDALVARSAEAVDRARESARKSEIRNPAVYDAGWDERRRVSEWLTAVKTNDKKPAVAALAWQAWDSLDPLQRSGFLGPMLVGHLLRARGKAKHHLPALHLGAQMAAMPGRRPDREVLLEGYLRAIEAAAAQGMKDLDRLALAAEALKRRCVGKRANSKMPALADLFVASSVVTVPLAAKRLKISQQAATTMIDALSPALREITGRERYRAWSLL